MKASIFHNRILTIALLVVSASAFAVTPEEDEIDKKCIKPKFRDFAPPAKAEVDPGSELSFHVSHNADAPTIGAEAKTQKMAVSVKDRNTFYEVKAKLPADLKGTFARISIHARAADGECVGHDGWLIKIKGDGSTPAANSVIENQAKAAENPAK